MENYIKDETIPFPDYLEREHLLQAVELSVKKSATQRAAGLVCQVTGNADDGSYTCQSVDGQEYGATSSAVFTTWSVGSWVTLEFAEGTYQIVGYGAFGSSAGDLLSPPDTTPSLSYSPNNGATTQFSG